LPGGGVLTTSPGVYPMNQNWWFSCKLFTIRLTTNERGIIVQAAPIARKFIGQPLANLERWQHANAIRLEPFNDAVDLE